MDWLLLCSCVGLLVVSSTGQGGPDGESQGVVQCGGTFSGTSGEITSPKWPENYPNSTRCTYRIEVPDNMIVHLHFNHFDLEFSYSCRFDYLEITDGASPIPQSLSRRLCGTELPEMLISTGNVMVVTFVSDSSLNEEGFKATYQAVARDCTQQIEFCVTTLLENVLAHAPDMEAVCGDLNIYMQCILELDCGLTDEEKAQVIELTQNRLEESGIDCTIDPFPDDEDDAKKDRCNRSVDVAIVGAGPSGSYSAYKLRNAGQSVELFEYSDRIGGRLFTSSLPNIPDVNLELGGMRFVDGAMWRVQQVVDELGLTPIVFKEGFGRPGRTRYYLRGQSMTKNEALTGDIPYDLSEEEKENQDRIIAYYLEKLTGYNESIVPREMWMKLRVADGRELYKLTYDEALDMVATPEGKAFAEGLEAFTTFTTDQCSSIVLFDEHLGEFSVAGEVLTVQEGMSAIPNGLVNVFLGASDSHKITLNRHLKSIKPNKKGDDFVLKFQYTTTEDSITESEDEFENVCAQRVILALPQYALEKVDWKPLRAKKVREALHSVEPIHASKVFMTFSNPWWLEDSNNTAYVTKSDIPFSQMYDWMQSNETGDYVMIASYADNVNTDYQWELNSDDTLMVGSAPGGHSVSETLKDDLLDHLAEAFGADRSFIPEPTAAKSQFWNRYPFGGGWSQWLAGYNFDDVRYTIRRPSLKDDVFVVGSDWAFGIATPWVEGGFETVDEVFDAYF